MQSNMAHLASTQRDYITGLLSWSWPELVQGSSCLARTCNMELVRSGRGDARKLARGHNG